MREGITFNDVLIVPKYSDIESRLDISVLSKYLGDWRLPVISAPMDTVSGPKLVAAMTAQNAYGILHRFGSQETLIQNVKELRSINKGTFGISIGVKDFETTKSFLDAVSGYGIHSVCIDVAHGEHNLVAKTIGLLQEWTYKEGFSWHIIAGNVATSQGFFELARAGADAIRVGIGPGSACTTRETTGVGVPQLSAIMDCAIIKARLFPNVTLIADGGIQTPGDIAKALAAGADAVMLGRLLAGTSEAAGEATGGQKVYRGQSTVGSNGLRGAPEGISSLVPTSGPIADTLSQLMHYLRSSMSYVGARNLTDFRQLAEFIRVSPATYQESIARI